MKTHNESNSNNAPFWPFGHKSNITVTATRGAETKEENVYCDGYNVTVKKEVVTEKNKHHPELYWADIVGCLTRKRPSPKTPVFYGYFLGDDDKTVMPFDENVYATIENCKNEAETEAETDGSYTEYAIRQRQPLREDQEYDEHVKRVENMMTLNGRTY